MSRLTYGSSVSQKGFIHSPGLEASANKKVQPEVFLRRINGLYALLLGLLVALMSLMAINYLEFFLDTGLRFDANSPYELTSMLAIGLGVFITYVTWRCWMASRDVFLRWLVLAFLGFTLIYLLCIAIFAEASIAFVVSDLRSHLWWLAHAIVAAGFILLSFGVFQAFQATCSFANIYSKPGVLRQLHEQQAQTRETLANLEATNARLSQQAATDRWEGVPDPAARCRD